MLSVLLSLLITPTAEACSCMFISEEEKIQQAAVVFTGKVEAISHPDSAGLPMSVIMALPSAERDEQLESLQRGSQVIFSVQSAWKGVTASRVSVSVGSGQCCDCTFGPDGFTVGEVYSITAYNVESPEINTCSAVIPTTTEEVIKGVLGKPALKPPDSGVQGG